MTIWNAVGSAEVRRSEEVRAQRAAAETASECAAVSARILQGFKNKHNLNQEHQQVLD